MTISTQDCKKAIVDYCQKNGKQIIEDAYGSPEHVYLCEGEGEGNQETLEQAIAPMLLEKNWKRESKEKIGNGLTERGFDCRPYDSSLRAYVCDDGMKIVDIRVVGE